MRPLVVFSGAGENHKVEDVAEHQAWFRDKELVLKFYEAGTPITWRASLIGGIMLFPQLEEKFNITHVSA